MATPSGRSARLASYLGRFSPVPAFPDYTGPYAVGSVDVEVPVDPGEPGPAEAQAAGIGTVQFRVFYPADAAAAPPRVRWLPAPQRQYVAAYAQFLGARARVADAVSYLGRHLHYVELPVGEAATMAVSRAEHGADSTDADPAGDERPDAAHRWPTLIFSHGLGGSRNAYAHLAASVASHGVVVVCPEHRDGSAVISFMKTATGSSSTTTTSIPFQRIPHTETADAWGARDAQLRIRLWELERVHAALLRLDGGTLSQDNLAADTPAAALDQLAGRLDVHRPGAIAWAGHSFGGASIVQLLKSVYYADAVLYSAPPASPLRAQITAASPTILLDVWCFPLRSPTTRALYERPLPAWQADEPGRPLLAIGSEAFYKWTVHLHETARILSPGGPVHPQTPSSSSPPAIFYVARSAHLSQSDFGLVFPWLTRAVFKAPAPERALRLNVRAILQLLRRNGVAVARTSAEELVENIADVGTAGTAGTNDDTAILVPHGGVTNWVWMDVAALAKEGVEGAESAKHEVVEGVMTGDGSDSDALEKAKLDTADKATEASMEGEIEQHIAA